MMVDLMEITRAYRKSIADAARDGDSEMALAVLREAIAALHATDDPALQYVRECVGRLLVGQDERTAFNFGKRKPGRQPYPFKPMHDEILRFEVRVLRKGAAALGFEDEIDAIDAIAKRLKVSREVAMEGGMTVEEAVHHVAEIYNQSPDTVHTALYGRR